MTDSPARAPRRPAWVVATVVGAVFAIAIAAGGLWALAELAGTGAGSPWGILTGAGSGVIFWGWISAGCWRRATEPEPDPYEPAPVARSRAFVAANVVLALLFTAMVAGGVWIGVRSAREAERIELISHRVMVAAREVDLTVEDLNEVDVERQAWLASAGGGAAPVGRDPLVELLPVEGAQAISLAVDDGEGEGEAAVLAAVLFRPDEGPPCVVLDIDADGLLSTRSTTNCS